MKTWVKWILRACTALALLAGLLLAWNWSNIQRLLRVNSLFSEDKIVNNFSDMRGAFFHKDMPVDTSTPTSLPKMPRVMPKAMEFNGKTIQFDDWNEQRSRTAIVVLKDGNLVYEDYFQGTGPNDRRISWSMAKSYLSALTGILHGEGVVPNLDIIVSDVVPALKGSGYEGATLRNVLNMASGVSFNEDYLDYDSDINVMGRTLALGGSMDEFAASLGSRDWDAGTYNKYVSIDTHVIGMVLRALSGRPIPDLLAEKMLNPMGLEHQPYYLTDGNGTAFVLGGLNLSTRDYARFGQMFAQGGFYNGKQIVPADWVQESTSQSAPPVAPDRAAEPRGQLGYAYQWWLPPSAADGEYFAIGVYGQYIYVNTAKQVVIALNSADRQFADQGGIHTLENIEMFRTIARSLDQG